MTDSELGRKAVVYFHQQALDYNSSLPSDFESFMGLLRRAYYPSNLAEAPVGYSGSYYPKSSNEQKNEYIYENLGISIKDSAPTESEWKHILSELAASGGGRIPTTRQTFGNAIRDYKMGGGIYGFIDMVKFVAQETVADVKEKVTNVIADTTMAFDIAKYGMYAAVLGSAALAYKLLSRKKV